MPGEELLHRFEGFQRERVLARRLVYDE